MTFKPIILVIVLLFGMSVSLNLQPDVTNPMMMSLPTNLANGQSLVFRFSFPSQTPNQIGPMANGSTGITHKQFIGVQFPLNIGTELALDQGATPKFSCALTDGVYTYSVAAVQSVTSPVSNTMTAESNIAYCRLDDMSANVPLKTGPAFTYRLTLTLTGVKFTSSYIRAISLFTSTSNNPEKIIIDSIPVIGSLAIYGDYTASTPKPLDVPNAVVSVTQGPSASNAATTVYAYNQFDVTLTLKSNSFISAADHVIVFKYPTLAVSPAGTVITSDAAPNDPLQVALKGNLSVKSFGTDGIYLDGMGEDLIPNRQFKLTLKGWKSLDTQIDSNLSLYTIVYYKNTYSILSYVQSNVFSISSATVALSVNHPEYWDVYEGGAWPISFFFTANNDLTNGGWVVIQHTNAASQTTTEGLRVSFVASTCDFSANDSTFDNSFGKRPNCYPLRNDQNYNTAVTPYRGSGIFFNMKGPITSGKTYKLTVWAIFDMCGGTNDDALNVVNKPTLASRIPKFQLTIYKYMNPGQVGEARFTTMVTGIASNQVIAQSIPVDFNGKCWNNIMFTSDSALNTQTVDGTVVSLTAAGGATLTSVLYYKEVNNWETYAQTSDSAATTGLEFFSHTTAASTFVGIPPQQKYYFSTSNLIGTGAYFLAYFRTPCLVGATATQIATLVPTPLIVDKRGPPGKVVYQFSSAWFVAGQGYKTGTTPASTCFASWSLSTQTAADPPVGRLFTGATSKLIPGFTGSNLVYGGAAAKKNFFGVSTDEGNLIDQTNSRLPPDMGAQTGPANIMKLVSAYTGGEEVAANSRFIYMGVKDTMITGTTATDFAQMGFFTSCVKWTTSVPSITSLFTYIDVQIKFNYIATGDTSGQSGMGTTISAIRLIKLFPENGVFQDFDKTPSTTSTQTTNPFTNHVAYMATNSAGTDTGICLLELSGSILAGAKDPSANTLVLWLFGATLLETDYFDQAATYPAGPLVSGITTYGLTSAQPMDSNNQHLTQSGTTYTAQQPLTQIFSNLNESKDLATANVNFLKSNASHYMFFMGSVLAFTSVTTTNLTGTTEQSLYVPYYCPKYYASLAGVTAVAGSTFYPTVIGAWINMSGHSTIGTFYRHIAYKDALSAWTNIRSYVVIGSRVDTAGTGQMNIIKTPALTVGATISAAMLKWTAYTNTNQLLYVYNGTNAAAGSAALYCTGHVLFLHSSITIDPAVTTQYQAGYSGSIGVYNSSKTFYALGKPFTKGVFYGLGTAAAPTTANMNALAATTTSDTDSSQYYTGIRRPTVDTFVSGGNLVLTDRVAFSCVSCNKGQNTILTNYIVNTTGTNTVSNFLLDWNRRLQGTGSDWLSPSIAWDKTDVYKSDPAANLKVVLSPPVSVPAGTLLKFTASSNAFTGNTICGLVITTGAIVNQCTNVAGTISCTAPNGGTSFTVCCYNVAVSDPLALNSLIASFPADPTIIGLNTLLTPDVYSAATQLGSQNNPYSFVTANSGATDIVTTKSASITSISYSQVNQEGGIGKVVFAITLPREPVRDMKLSVIGDLSGMSISGNVPRCYASFANGLYGAFFDNGDALIDTCSTNNIGGGTPIVITTKKLVYKCGISFSKSLYVSLWPIIVVNWSAASVNKSFRVTMQLNASDNIALNTSSFNMALATPVAAKAAVTGQWDNLCTVSSITPRIPGEVADYVFDFDLDTNKSSIANTNPNEVSIFFPYQYYGSFAPNVSCYYTGPINCSFTDEGILNIRFSTNLTVGSGKKISITVIGIMNPAIDTDYSFPCTVNNTNFTSGARTNLITGSGKLSGGITTTNFTTMGNLRFLSVAQPVTDRNPRNTSVHKFRVTFDNAINLTSTSSPIVLANTPVIHVMFPSNYRLAWYNNKPSATIDEFTSDANNLITKTSSLSPASVTLSGNRITLTMSVTSVTFGVNWRYWDITISNIVNPTDTTNQTGPPLTQTTRTYSVILTNTNNSALYKTYTNVNTYATDSLTTAVDAWLVFNRGLSFNFDNTKFIVDIYSNASQLNVLTLRPGRFLQAYFNIKTNNNIALNPWVSDMSLSDGVFKTSLTTYRLSTSLMQPLPFYVGCACGTATGYYLVNFTSSDSTNFSALSPVVITVDTSTVGTISFQTPPNIPAAGSVYIGLILSEPNFDALNINWTAGDSTTNDSTAKISNIVIPIGTITPTSTSSTSGQLSPVYSIFSITSSSTTLPSQVFKTIDPNACYSFNGANSLSLNISGQTAIIPNNLSLATFFKYSNSATDTTLTNKNSIRFNFTAPAAPIYIFCALTCINQPYPADVDIMTPKVQNTPLLQFYNNIISNTTPVDIIFNNLVRGLQYHMRCIILSTQGDPTLRTNSSVSLENYLQVGASNSSTVPLMPQPPQTTQCAQFQFLSEPGQSIRASVINYCQRVFSAPGWLNNGCIICTNSDITYNVPGLAFSTNITCPAPTKSKLRFLQASSTAPSTVTNITTSLTVCPVPNPVCATDASGNKAYNDYFTQFTNDLKTAALFKQTLNIDNVFLNATQSIITFNDAVAPDITKVPVSVVSSNINGAVSFTIAGPSPLKCYWQIADSSVAQPTYMALSSCSDISWCGNAKVGIPTTTISTTNLKVFTYGLTYNIFIGCSNDIPLPQSFSAVKSGASFTMPAAPAPSSLTNTTGGTTSANFINASMFVILLIFSIIFN